jgi:predicted nucleic acid-binding protein
MTASDWVKFKYLDATALVKLYIKENDSQHLRDFFSSNQTHFRTTWLCLAEALGCLKSKWIGPQSKKVATKIDTETYFEASLELLFNWRLRIELDDLKLVNPSIPLKVEEIAKKYKLDYSDALQLITIKNGEYSSLAYESAPGVYEPALVLITADKDLAFAAESEGIRVWNCTTGPAPDWLY